MAAGCSSGPATPSTTLVYDGSRAGNLVLKDKRGPVTYGMLVLCVSSGPVTVTAITAGTVYGDVVIQGWGHRPNPMATGGAAVGAAFSTLAALGFNSDPVSVSGTCPTRDHYLGADAAPELAVQLGRTGSRGGWIDGLSVTYRSEDGQLRHLFVPWQVGMCGSDPIHTGLLECP